jgi:hypothetical protein
MSLDISPKNLMRLADWRWHRARNIAEHITPYSRRRDDRWINQAAKFYQRQMAVTTDYENRLLEEDHPHVDWGRLHAARCESVCRTGAFFEAAPSAPSVWRRGEVKLAGVGCYLRGIEQ